jgi:hypothetical protein
MKLRTTAAATLIAAAASLAAAAPASAAVTFDPSTGSGFVGKGDVQVALGWNNKQLQDNAAGVSFTYETTTVQETSWTCVNQNNGHVQERSRTTTATVSGVASSVARENSKGKDGAVTGFDLNGYAGGSSSNSSTAGPPLNSCPNAQSSHVLDSTVVGEPETVGGGLQVNGVSIG